MKFLNSTIVLPEPKAHVFEFDSNIWTVNFRNSPTPEFKAIQYDLFAELIITAYTFNTKVGITSIICENYITILAVGRHINDDLTKGIQIYFDVGFLLHIFKETYKLVSADNDDPSWFVDSMHHDDFGQLNTGEHFFRTSAIALPYYSNTGPYPISKTGRGKVLYINIEKFTITSLGSPFVQVFAVDIMASHQNQFYAFLEHASI